MQGVPKRREKRITLYEMDLYMKRFQFMLVATVEVKQKIFTNSVPSSPIAKFSEYRSYDRSSYRHVSVINTLRYPVRKSVIMS